MGRALQVLKSKGVADAMGYGSFETLCAKQLDLSATRADLLIKLYEKLDASLVRELGTDRASALMNLADATPEDDRVEDLLAAKLVATRKESGADAQVRMPLTALVALVAAARKGGT